MKIDKQFRMYVADFGSYRIQVYQKDFVPLSLSNSHHLFVRPLCCPNRCPKIKSQCTFERRTERCDLQQGGTTQYIC